MQDNRCNVILHTPVPPAGSNDRGDSCLVGSRPPLVGVPCCRPGIHGVAPTVRQQGTPTRGSAVQIIPGSTPLIPSPVYIFVVQLWAWPLFREVSRLRSGSPLPSTTSAGGFLWVESHSDAFATWSWAWRSGKNGKLFEDTPARSFCRSAQPCPTPCQTRQRVKPTGTPRHGSLEKAVLNDIASIKAWPLYLGLTQKNL